MAPVLSLWILQKKPRIYFYISWDNTSYFNGKALTSQGFKRKILSTLTKSSQWEAGLTELYSIESYTDPGSEDLLSSTQLALDINTQSKDRASEGIMCKWFIYVASVASGMWNFHPYSINQNTWPCFIAKKAGKHKTTCAQKEKEADFSNNSHSATGTIIMCPLPRKPTAPSRWWCRAIYHLFLLLQGFPGGSDSKESICNVRDLGSIPGLGRSARGGAWQPTPVFLPGESPWTEEPGRLQSMGSQSQTQLSN